MIRGIYIKNVELWLHGSLHLLTTETPSHLVLTTYPHSTQG